MVFIINIYIVIYHNCFSFDFNLLPFHKIKISLTFKCQRTVEMGRDKESGFKLNYTFVPLLVAILSQRIIYIPLYLFVSFLTSFWPNKNGLRTKCFHDSNNFLTKKVNVKIVHNLIDFLKFDIWIEFVHLACQFQTGQGPLSGYLNFIIVILLNLTM